GGPFWVDTPGRCSARLLSLAGKWLDCTVTRHPLALSIDQLELVVGGMSGSPIVTTDGRAIGVISTERINPILTECLPGRFLHDRRRPRQQGALPRSDRKKPWEAMGISQRTWQRHGKPTSETGYFAAKAQAIDAEDRANQRPGKYPTGNSAANAIRRLRKDRPDIHTRVLAGELSAHAGMIEAGFRKKMSRETAHEAFMKAI